ncbi:MAG: DapH/DapD/GlmU-related protein [Candidatus Helarchaeota archaeon]
MDESIKLGKNVIFHEQVKVGKDTEIGNNVELGINDELLIIGENATIRSGSIIYGGVVIGNGFITGHNIMVREKTTIGNNVIIGTNSIIDGNCNIGNNVSIQSGVYVTWGVTIEDGVFMGPFAKTTNDKFPPARDKSVLIGPILRKKCSIGSGAIILPGIEIGENSLIGAGSVVTKNIPPNVIAFGNPCKVMKKRE